MRMLITGGLVARADGVFNTDILIEGDRILELGERLHEAQQPEGTEIVDVSGCVVMPGGVDAHTHVNLTVGDARVSDGFEERWRRHGAAPRPSWNTRASARRDAICPISPPRIWSRRMAAATRTTPCTACSSMWTTPSLPGFPRSWRRDFPRSRPTPPMTAGWMTKGCCRFSPRSGMRAACSPSIAKTTPSPVFWGTNCAAKRRAIP